ncbi:MAG: DoxX family protein [Prolixibacteraceae bacterium]|nr:DoxX family protein [Prolixibacteraceae bacterium]
MLITISILKVVIAWIFTFTGTFKVFFPKEKLLAKGMKGLVDLNEKQIKAAGLLEILGALGLILPAMLNIFPLLSEISALCLGLTMIVAGRINYKLKLSIIPNIVIFAVCIFIAFWGLKYF